MKLIKFAILALCSCFLLSNASTAQETVRIVNIGQGYYAGPLYVAVREKLFEKHGLKPEVTFVKGGAIAYQAVLTQNADFGILSYEHILTAAAQGRNLTAIFNIAHRPLNNIVVDNDLYVANKDKSLSDRLLALKGKRVGAPSAGGSGEKMLGVLAQTYGLKLPGDVELVYLGSDASSYVGAFKTNLIDAAMPVEPAGVLLEQEGLGNILVNLMSGEIEAFRDLVFMTVATHPETLQKKPELARKVAAVFSEAQKILLDPVRGKAIMAQEFPTMDPKTNSRAYEIVSQIWSKDGRMTLEGAKKVYNYLKPPGQAVINYEKTFTNDLLVQP